MLCAHICAAQRLQSPNHDRPQDSPEVLKSVLPCRDAGERWPCPYKFGDKQVKTDKWLLLERGTSQRYFPMALVRVACWFWVINVALALALALQSWIHGCCFSHGARAWPGVHHSCAEALGVGHVIP